MTRQPLGAVPWLLATGAAAGREAMASRPAARQSLREARAQAAHLAASSAAAHADEERPWLRTIGLGRRALTAAASRRSHVERTGPTSTDSAGSRRDARADAVSGTSGAMGACAQSAKSLCDSRKIPVTWRRGLHGAPPPAEPHSQVLTTGPGYGLQLTHVRAPSVSPAQP